MPRTKKIATPTLTGVKTDEEINIYMVEVIFSQAYHLMKAKNLKTKFEYTAVIGADTFKLTFEKVK